MTIRVGLGYDVHAFVAPTTPHRKLVLAGVELEGRGLAGHSDADAVAHAVADALLGPAGLPDLGTLFPASDDQYRDASSLELLRDVCARVAESGWQVVNVDIVIAAEEPRLAPHLDAMARNLVDILGPDTFVSIKPKRGEGIGAIGRAEGIAVWARQRSSRVCGITTQVGRNHRSTLDAMAVRIRDTLLRDTVELVPRDPGKVSIYVCGPTVYDVAHVGHGRTALVFDVIRRYLEWTGFDVDYVSNITDVEDKIIARAAERGTSESELAGTYEQAWFDAMAQLGVRRPDHVPHATDYIDGMLELISELIERGHAYAAEDGVYFDVDSFPGYGALPHRSLEELRESAGARVEVDEAKRSPMDFALWKAAKPGEPAWDSPWGKGRPGWHIECSAMALDLLGEGFDLHGAGDDLVFPHHENERVQAEGAGHPVRAPLDPRGHGHRGRREDGEVGRQLHDDRRRARHVRRERISRRRAQRALPPSDRARREGARGRGNWRRKVGRARSTCGRERHRRRGTHRSTPPRSSSSAARWTTTSTRRTRSPRSSRQRLAPTAPSTTVTSRRRRR